MNNTKSIIALKALVDRLHSAGDMLCTRGPSDESLPKFAFVFDARNLLDGKANNVEESACALARHFVDSDRPLEAESVLTTLLSYLSEHSAESDTQLLNLYEALFAVQDDAREYARAIETHKRTHELKVKLFGKHSREVAESCERGGRLYEHYSETVGEETYLFQARCLREQALECLIAARDIYHEIEKDENENLNDMDRVQNLMHLMAMHLL